MPPTWIDLDHALVGARGGHRKALDRLLPALLGDTPEVIVPAMTKTRLGDPIPVVIAITEDLIVVGFHAPLGLADTNVIPREYPHDVDVYHVPGGLTGIDFEGLTTEGSTLQFIVEDDDALAIEAALRREDDPAESP